MQVFRDVWQANLPALYEAEANIIPPGPPPPAGTEVRAPWTKAGQLPVGFWSVRWRYVLERMDLGSVARLCWVEEKQPATQNPALDAFNFGISYYDVEQSGLALIQGPATLYIGQSPASGPPVTGDLDCQVEITAVRVDLATEVTGQAFGRLGHRTLPDGTIYPGISPATVSPQRVTARLTYLKTGAGAYLGPSAPPDVAVTSAWQANVVQVPLAQWDLAGSAGAANRVRVQTALGQLRGYVGDDSRWPLVVTTWPSNGGTGVQVYNDGPNDATGLLVILERSSTPPSAVGQTTYPQFPTEETLAVGPWTQILAPAAGRRFLRVENQDPLNAVRVRFFGTDPWGWLLPAGQALTRAEPLPAGPVEATAVAGAPVVRAWQEDG